MFYAHFVLAKRGPLAKIWLAAHWDKKLTKSHVFETNIEHSVEGILQPKVKMALRTSGHLLLGIVRIYSRKAKYLLADCNEAFIKIKMAFRPGVVDLPENNREAAVATITLPEVFHDFDTTIPDITIDMDASVNLNQSRAEDITLKEDYSNLQLMADDAFDMAFDEPEAARDATNIDEGFEHASLLLCEEAKERSEETINTPALHTSNNSGSKANSSIDQSLKSDGFGGCLLDETGSLFEPAGLFDDAPLDHVSLENADENIESSNANEKQPQDKRLDEDSDDDDMYDMGPGSMGAPSPPSSAASVHESNAEIFGSEPNGRLDMCVGDEPFLPVSGEKSGATGGIALNDAGADRVSALGAFDHHKLMNEEESFALGPLDASIVEGPDLRIVKSKRKRKLIVDEVKNISGEEMKLQLSDTTDIIVTLDLAPPTKRLMHFKETGGVEKLFSLPGHIILSKTLSKAYQMHLTTRSVENEAFGFDEDLIDLDADLGEGTKERDRGDETEIASVSRKRRLDEDPMLPPGENLTPHLDAFSHPSFEVTNFLQSHQHMFPPNATQQIPQQEMMSNVMSVMSHQPQAHMIQQMLQPDVNQLSHIPQIMHPSMVDQGPPLHAINPSIHNPAHPPPVVPDAYNQSIGGQSTSYGTCSPPQHLLAETIPQIADHLHHSDIDKQMPTRPPLDERLNESNLQNLQTQTADQMPCTENTLTLVSNAQQNTTTHTTQTIQLHENSVDDDLTQPCLGEDFPAIIGENKISNGGVTPTLSGSLSSETILHNETSNAPIKDMNVCGEGETCENEDLVPVDTRQECNSSDLLFDSLNNNNNGGIDSHTQNRMQDHNDDEQPQKNDPCFPLSDDDDYGAPPSVGPALPEEQMADETYEQFEERILVKRTTHMLHLINGLFDDRGALKFGALIKGSKRKQVAQKFYTFLVLKKLEAVELEHDEKGELIITRGLKYNTVYNGN